MKNQLKPYFVADNTVYFTDKVEEVIVYTDEREGVAEKISILLNETYNAAYQDGLNASLNKEYKELMSKVQHLSVENWRLKGKMELNED